MRGNCLHKKIKVELITRIATLKSDADADALALQCDSKMNAKKVLEIVTKSNAFRKSAIEKDIMVVGLAKTLNKLGEDLKNLIFYLQIW